MRVKHCPECLSKHGTFVIVWPDEGVCRECGREPTEQLTPNEIRACIGVEVSE